MCSVSDSIVIDRWFVDYIAGRHQHHYYHQFITAVAAAAAAAARP